MKNKIFIPILCVLLILLAMYTYTLKKEINLEKMRTEQHSKTIDSLRQIMDNKKSQELLMREKAEQIIAKSQKEADSLRKLNKSN
jgi:hypothetical protein